MPDAEFVFVYTTLPDDETADAIASALVEARLAACANIYPGMRSVYQWQGKIERDAEVGMLIKTRAELAEEVMAEVRKRHPFDTPALVVLPLVGGDPAYLDWLREETGGA